MDPLKKKNLNKIKAKKKNNNNNKKELIFFQIQ